MDRRRKRPLYHGIIARIETLHGSLGRLTLCDLAELQGGIGGSKAGLPATLAGRAPTQVPRIDDVDA